LSEGKKIKKLLGKPGFLNAGCSPPLWISDRRELIQNWSEATAIL